MDSKKMISITFMLAGLLFLMAGGGPNFFWQKLFPLKISFVYAQETDSAGDYVDQGRQKIEEQDIKSANNYFSLALEQDSSHREANLYYSVTRILVLAYENGFNNLLDRFGMGEEGRNLYNWTAELPQDANGEISLPTDSPRGSEVITALETTMLSEIDAALSNLEKLESTKSDYYNPIAVLTKEMISSDRKMEVDYGDVALYRSFLYLSKTLLLMLTNYDLNIDIDNILSKIKKDTLNIKTDIIQAYPQLLNRNQSGMSGAQALKSSIDAYLAASNFIRNEQDPQEDDLVSFYAEDLADEKEFRTVLTDVRTSLDNQPVCFDLDFDQPVLVNLYKFYDGPINLRSYLPSFSKENEIVHNTLPDPTFNGIFPYLSQADWKPFTVGTYIKANGSNSPITVSPQEPVSVSISLDPGEKEGQAADWWIAAQTPFNHPHNWISYVYPAGWQTGINLCLQNPLFEISSPIEVLNMNLPKGDYTFYFAVDEDADGQLDVTWFDFVEVNVK